MKTVFICKTNLNNDGRILNQIKILQNHYKDKLQLDFILFPDKPLTIDLGENVRVHQVKTLFRNSSFLRILTVIEFTIKALFKLYKLKPEVAHTQDMAVVLPVYFYRVLKGKTFKLIYDDHEMPNENQNFQQRIFTRFEVKLMKISDYIIFANQERMDRLRVRYDLRTRSGYFLNLPYFDHLSDYDKNGQYVDKIADLRRKREEGYKFLMHQGVLDKERGREKLAKFSKKLPQKCRILIVGVSENDFKAFIAEYGLDFDHFHWIGSVPYLVLNEFWKLVDAAIIMYLPTYINNRLCAPNRLYIAMNHGIPVVVNKENPVLYNFIETYKIGVYIEEVDTEKEIFALLEHKYSIDIMKKLKEIEIAKFISIYQHN